MFRIIFLSISTTHLVLILYINQFSRDRRNCGRPIVANMIIHVDVRIKMYMYSHIKNSHLKNCLVMGSDCIDGE